MRCSPLLLPALLIPAFVLPARADEPVDLRFRVKPGQSLYYIFKTSQTMDRKLAGRESNLRWSSEMRYTLKIIAQQDQQVEATITYERLALQVSTPEGDLRFDTSIPTADPKNVKLLEDFGRRLIGVPLTLKVSPDGTITSVEGEEKFAPLPKSNLFLNEYTDETDIKQTLIELFSPGLHAPDAARAGDSWEYARDPVDLAGMAKVSRTSTYRLGTITKDQATIDASSKVTMTTKEGIKGEASETMTSYGGAWNLADGCLDTWHSAGEASMTLEAPQGKVEIRSSGNDLLRRVAEFPK